MILEPKSGTKQILDAQGADGLVQWVKDQKEVLLTDTTFRDAHQSLLATRIRTNDFRQIAEPTSKLFLNYSPWKCGAGLHLMLLIDS